MRYIHTGKTQYHCDIYGISFSRRSDLTTHKYIHTGKFFSQTSQLTIHNTCIHTGERPHRYDICGKPFAATRYLAKYVHIHTRDRPYHCDICGISFSQTGHLTTHKSIHTGEKPYLCDICSKSFTKTSHLTIHRYILLFEITLKLYIFEMQPNEIDPYICKRNDKT
ncbi:zinc finger protein 239-like [Octopus bimaculoides]|uniref:zinc finger protein 239-like n=1 Tax=Octopus bimaculoides TaxID=37653 RepID=UPI0022DFE4D8|nr:zinc finger protein 239-like [Octopus bimaculoides]